MKTLFLLFSLILSLFVNVAEAKDETSNGSVIGRPEVSGDCANVRFIKEHMRPEDFITFQAGCIRAYEATTSRTVDELDALGRYHLATTVPVGGSAIARRGEILTGVAAENSVLLGTPFGMNGAVTSRLWGQFAQGARLDGLVGYSGSMPMGSTTSTVTTRTTTAPARTDAEIAAESAARMQADADSAKAAADALRRPAGQ